MSKVILITGASTGLGSSLATYLWKKGHIVYGSSRTIAPNEHPFKTIVLDVSNTQSVNSAIAEILNDQGRIDVVINNAGLGLAGAVELLSQDDIRKVFDTNIFGVLNICQAVIPAMRSKKSGKIINISSIASEMGLPYRGGYCASKAALERLTEALRMEVASFGIQACTVQPGGIATDISKNRVVSMPSSSIYHQSFDRTYNIINESVSKGLKPEVFGPQLEKIINTSRLKRTYRIGKFTEKLSVLLKAALPDFLFEKIISNHYKV